MSVSKAQASKIFLFSVDLEDIRLRMDDGLRYKERVPQNTEAIIKWLSKHKSQCTFFVTGDVAELYPSLINELVQEGHEIGCHTSRHVPIDQQTPESFRKDLEENIEVLLKAGAKEIHGFRAPLFSLIEKTRWAYDVLADLKFTYSSSILPAKNPFYGWEDFGQAPRKVDNGIIEIPMTVSNLGGVLTVPAFGGVYLRALPTVLIHYLMKQKFNIGLPVLGYLHPYDIDTEQEKFMHPGIGDSAFYNFLLNYNRKSALPKLDKLMAYNLEMQTYKQFIDTYFSN